GVALSAGERKGKGVPHPFSLRSTECRAFVDLSLEAVVRVFSAVKAANVQNDLALFVYDNELGLGENHGVPHALLLRLHDGPNWHQSGCHPQRYRLPDWHHHLCHVCSLQEEGPGGL
ncbi:unnamed protein product, partial [Ixodes pacificus]